MLKYAVALCIGLLAAMPAQASNLIDFEDFELGREFAYVPVEYPAFLALSGSIVDAGGANGKALLLEGDDYPPGYFSRFLFMSNRSVPGLAMSPGNVVIDFFAFDGGTLSIGGRRFVLPVGEWTTLDIGLGNFNGGYLSAHRYGRIMMDNIRYDWTYVSVPEPANWAMLIAGFGLVGGTLRQRRRLAA